jgi:hypothetical protein
MVTWIAQSWRRVCAILLVLSGFLAAALSAAPARAAVSSQDAQNISLLRSMFGVNGSDTELAQLLDSPQIGASIVGNIDCAWFGEHALDSTTNGAIILSPLTQELSQVESSDQFVEDLITSDLESLLPDEVSTVLDADQELDYFASHMQTYINVLGQAYSESEYLSALSDYYGNWYNNGDDPSTAQNLTTEDLGSGFLGSLAQDRGISLSEMWAEFSYASTCMNLAQDSSAQSSYAAFINALVSDLESYDGHNGASALVVVPVSSSEINVINTGNADVTNLTLSAGSETVAASDLPAGETETVALEGTGVQWFGATFSVDGISDVSATIAPTSTYLGTPIGLPETGDPTTFQFSVEDGPFAANRAAPTYSWDYGHRRRPAAPPLLVLRDLPRGLLRPGRPDHGFRIGHESTAVQRQLHEQRRR